MREVKREQTEVTQETPTGEDLVTTTDPVTGQVVHVNRTTGEISTRPGMNQTIYRPEDAVDARVHEQEVREVTEDPYASRRAQAIKGEQVIYLIFSIIEILIAIRFVLRLLAANPAAGFASFIYGVTAPFVAPFEGLFGTPGYNGSVFDLNSIVAIVVYAIIAWLLVRLLWLLLGEPRSAVRSTVEQTDRRVP